MQRRSVDLPEPDGPIRATAEPLRHLERDALQHLQRPERLPQVADLDHRSAASAASWLIASVRSLQAPLHDLGAERQRKEDRQNR